jgi:outer membrane protein assembly factor BamB
MGEYGTFRENPERRPSVPCGLRPPLAAKWYQGLDFLPIHPVVASNRVFVVRKDGRTEAKDEQTGRIIWVSQTRGAPAAVDSSRLVHYGQRIAILDPASGRVRSHLEGPGAMKAAWCENRLVVQTFRLPSWRIYTASSETGKVAWEYSLAATGSNSGSPSRFTGCFGATTSRVICGVGEGGILALRLVDGNVLWDSSVADLQWELVGHGMRPGEAMGAVVLYQDMVLLEVLGGHVAALDAATGKRRWVWTEGPDLAECYLYDDVYYAHSGGSRIWAIDPRKGTTLEAFDLYQHMPTKARVSIGEICGPFIVSETHFFTGSTTGHIAAFDRADGRYVWSDRPRGARGCTYYNGNYFMPVNGRLYYGDQSMGIHCWEESRPARAYSRTRPARPSTTRGTTDLKRISSRKR